jgi:hypothetical protein
VDGDRALAGRRRGPGPRPGRGVIGGQLLRRRHCCLPRRLA